MSRVNIPKTYVDPFARYQRDVVTVIVMSRSGGQTVLSNIDTIAKQLERSSQDIGTYISKQLGVRYNAKTMSVQGSHTRERVDDLIEQYIAINVLCKTCGNPETVMQPNNKLKCKSCGTCG